MNCGTCCYGVSSFPVQPANVFACVSVNESVTVLLLCLCFYLAERWAEYSRWLSTSVLEHYAVLGV